MLLWGSYAYLSLLVPSTLAGTISQHLKPFRLVAIAVAVCTTFAVLPLEAGILGDGWGNAGDLTMIRDIMLETSIGDAWLVQAVAAIALALTGWLVPRHQQPAAALCAGLLLACRALMGHAIMGVGPAGNLLQLSYLIHVLSSGAWLGALAPLLFIVNAVYKQDDGQDAARALRRFSITGQIMVALAVFTGAMNTALILGQLPLTWSQPYQGLLAAKICLVGGMVSIALINRTIIVPRFKSDVRPTKHLLLCTTTAELALGAGALVLVNIFGTLDPV